MESNTQNIRRVKLLPDTLINRIAAGEVVERPSAVLKELLENSLDAGADRIDIEIESGGKRLIRVRDNGRGMDEDDLLMCIERHATSKLAPDDDLIQIETLGFRGEALPSIGAVSHLTITSSTETGPGHQVVVDGGLWRGIKEVGANRGTTVEVARLFYNVPARRKFLKTDPTESAHLLDVAQCYALSRDGLRLTFRDGGREVLAVESRHDFRTRVYKVLGRAAAESLKPFEHKAGPLSISGWLGEPEKAVRSTGNLFMYVLGRPVKDRLLNRALAEGYGRMLPPGSWPAAVIFIDLDPADVDVNVHPAKAEVRFRRPGEIFSAISAAVAATIGRAAVSAAPLGGDAPPRLPGASAFAGENESGSLTAKVSAPAPAYYAVRGLSSPFPAETSKPPLNCGGASPLQGSDPPRLFSGESADRPETPVVPPWMMDETPPPEPAPEFTGEAAAPQRDDVPPPVDGALNAEAGPGCQLAAAAPAARPGPAPNFEDLRPLGQLYNSYILAQGSKGLYIIDQHAAHERILFNRLKDTMAKEGLPGQALLFPDTAELSVQEALAAENLGEHLTRLGFDLQSFGDRTFILKSAPAILNGHDPWPPLREILAAGASRLKTLEGAGLAEGLEAMAGSWLYSLACRAAIKAGDKMSIEAMEKLIEDMAVTPKGAYCPHGRPAIQLIERHTIERRFDRK